MDNACTDIAKMIDHSLLKPELTDEEIEEGCEIARKYDVASVCCVPTDVAVVPTALAGSDVRVAVVDAAHEKGVLVKVILENCYLTDELEEMGCSLCEQAGADFVKTSAGLAQDGATLEDLKLMRRTVSAKVQIKAAGGVRDLDMALKVREAGATRFGATQTAKIMEECYKRSGR